MDDFLGNNDVVTGFPSWNKACLEGVDEVTKVGFKMANKNFSDGFVEGVAKANWTELVDSFRLGRLRD